MTPHEHLAELGKRRESLARLRGNCPKCGERDQIQLRDWLTEPAKWKCRLCSTKWEYEPEGSIVLV